MTTLFVSDLHLTPRRPHIFELFGELLRGEARHADALYILGDLFEYWIGDDAAARLGYQPAIEQLRDLSEFGTPVYFMRGNRDFLVGEQFALETGCTILPDPILIELYGQATVLLHGDSLCTDDTEHQQFRRMVADRAWQRSFLDQPVTSRLREAERARAHSREHKGRIAMEIMDVNQDAVRDRFAEHGARLMIHGHTHRPAVHEQAGGLPRHRRIVLGDWYEHSSILRCTPGRQALDPVPG